MLMPPLVTPPGEGLAPLPEPVELAPHAATSNNIPQAAAVRLIARAGMVFSFARCVTSTVRHPD